MKLRAHTSAVMMYELQDADLDSLSRDWTTQGPVRTTGRILKELRMDYSYGFGHTEI